MRGDGVVAGIQPVDGATAQITPAGRGNPLPVLSCATRIRTGDAVHQVKQGILDRRVDADFDMWCRHKCSVDEIDSRLLVSSVERGSIIKDGAKPVMVGVHDGDLLPQARVRMNSQPLLPTNSVANDP